MDTWKHFDAAAVHILPLFHPRGFRLQPQLFCLLLHRYRIFTCIISPQMHLQHHVVYPSIRVNPEDRFPLGSYRKPNVLSGKTARQAPPVGWAPIHGRQPPLLEKRWRHEKSLWWGVRGQAMFGATTGVQSPKCFVTLRRCTPQKGIVQKNACKCMAAARAFGAVRNRTNAAGGNAFRCAAVD